MSIRAREWSVTEVRPRRMMWRLAVATLGVGAVGGAATAVLAALFAASDVSLVAWFLAFEVPIVLTGMIAYRLVAQPALSGRRLVWTTVGGFVLMAAAQAWPEGGSFAGDARYAVVSGGFGEFAARVGGQGLAVSALGALFGLVTAAIDFLVLALVLTLLRGTRAGIGLRATTALVTVVTLMVTTTSTVLVTGTVDARPVTGMAAALAGVGAVITARWLLAPRQA